MLGSWEPRSSTHSTNTISSKNFFLMDDVSDEQDHHYRADSDHHGKQMVLPISQHDALIPNIVNYGEDSRLHSMWRPPGVRGWEPTDTGNGYSRNTKAVVWHSRVSHDMQCQPITGWVVYNEARKSQRAFKSRIGLTLRCRQAGKKQRSRFGHEKPARKTIGATYTIPTAPPGSTMHKWLRSHAA